VCVRGGGGDQLDENENGGGKWEIEKCASDGCLPILNINYGTGMTVAN